MDEVILHHYDGSPYAEKIRLALGRKALAWRSVQTPMVLPKPDHMELTGGYRRVPVLQIGADVYCDSHCIARELDRRFPDPPLSPPGLETVEHGVSRWAETTFMMVILAMFGIGNVFPADFIKDRSETMVPPGADMSRTPLILGSKLLQIRANLDRLERMLSDGRAFLLGSEPCLADLSAYHPLMGLGLHERTQALLAPLRRVPAWMARVRAIGRGKPTEFTAAQAIAVAREATPVAFEGEPVLPDGIALGDRVVVFADEYGSGSVVGELAASDLHEIAVRRRGERVGDVAVHFPREDYGVMKIG